VKLREILSYLYVNKEPRICAQANHVTFLRAPLSSHSHSHSHTSFVSPSYTLVSFALYLILHFPPSLLDGQHISSNSQVTPLVPPQYSQPKTCRSPTPHQATSQDVAPRKACYPCSTCRLWLFPSRDSVRTTSLLGRDFTVFSYVFYLHSSLYTFLFYLSILPSGITAPHPLSPFMRSLSHTSPRFSKISTFWTLLLVVYVTVRVCLRQASHSLLLSFPLYTSNS